MYRTKCFTCFTVKVFGVFSTLAPLYAWDCVFVAESGEPPCGHAYCDTVLCLRLVKVCVPFSRCEPVHNNHAELMSRSACKVWQSVAVCFRFGPARRPDGKQSAWLPLNSSGLCCATGRDRRRHAGLRRAGLRVRDQGRERA